MRFTTGRKDLAHRHLQLQNLANAKYFWAVCSMEVVFFAGIFDMKSAKHRHEYCRLKNWKISHDRFSSGLFILANHMT